MFQSPSASSTALVYLYALLNHVNSKKKCALNHINSKP